MMRYCIVCRNDEESKKIANRIQPKIKHQIDEDNPELVIAVGGDGTIIKAFHTYPNAVLFGIHSGHLGFYANYNVDNLECLIEDINTGSYQIEFLDLLTCKITDEENKEIVANALNEITIVTPPRTLILDVNIDQQFFERFRGTGMCISTPYGSTAYNKSLHGCVIDPTLRCIQLTEIAGINSNAYRTLSSPLVLSQKKNILLKAISPQEVFITVDHLSYTVENFKSLSIYNDNQTLRMAYHSQENFLDRIRRTFLISQK